jgi:transcriptional regulator with XRE-family HTH domain
MTSSAQFRQRVEREFALRRQTNPRYSLRAFASFLECDHSTLSQILRDKRQISTRQLRSWGKKLGMSAEEVAIYVAALHVPDVSITDRQHQLLHWTSEALAIISDRSHWQILNLLASSQFESDSRWIAKQIGTGVDQVNVALARLLRLRLLKLGTSGKWKDLTCLGSHTEAEFKK